MDALRVATRDEGFPVLAWIKSTRRWQQLPRPMRRVLEAMAASAIHMKRDGCLTGIFGGDGLVTACGCARSTFLARRRKLEVLGFVAEQASVIATLRRKGIACHTLTRQ